MAVDEAQIAQAIYDNLFAAFTNPPQGMSGKSASQADKTFLTLNWPGQQIDVAEFANPWSPANPTGSTAATEKFSRLVDDNQSLFPVTSPNGNQVSKMYGLVVNAQVVPPPVSPAEKEAYDKAFNYLNTDGTDYDDSGKQVTVKVDSPVYGNYKRKLIAYNNAVVALMANYFQYDMSKPEDQRKWSLLGPTFQSAVQSAQNDLQNAQQTKVEDALATLAQSSNNQVGQAFTQARRQFQLMQRAGVVDPGSQWWATYAQPANWFAPNASAQWTAITVDSSSLRTSSSSDFSSSSAGAKASWGLWSGGGSFEKEDSHTKMSKDTSSLKVSFKFARISIERPWLNFLLFSLGGWNMGDAFPPGGISNGQRDQPLNTPMPVLSTSFVAVRDLQITGNWGHDDSEMISSKMKSSASFGWGPFAIEGSYATETSSTKSNSTFDGKTISNPGLQIIGWVNTLTPLSPPTPRAAADAADATPAAQAVAG
ncbi:MAG: hypothetical protein M3Y54_02655 [Bacteroidota bacterium]|nr:hypothetical protein [Bacteroidota bacterium]